MKTLLIIATMLTVEAMTHGYDAKRAQEFRDNVLKCYKILKGTASKFSIEVFRCVLGIDERVINDDGVLQKNETLKLIENIFAYPNSVTKAKAIFNMCYNNVVRKGGSAYEQTMNIMSCSKPLLLFLKETEE